ncbi:MAG: transposase [Deltaproteobacteria bacterium]|nr:transposase [Deltaproteobacteria bacterium]
MSGKKGMLHYSKTIKEKAVKMFLEEGVSYREIAMRLEIRDPARIEKWVQMYRQEGAASFEKPIGRPRKETRPQTELERLRMENDLLKKFHAELRKMELEKRNIG